MWREWGDVFSTTMPLYRTCLLLFYMEDTPLWVCGWSAAPRFGAHCGAWPRENVYQQPPWNVWKTPSAPTRPAISKKAPVLPGKDALSADLDRAHFAGKSNLMLKWMVENSERFPLWKMHCLGWWWPRFWWNVLYQVLPSDLFWGGCKWHLRWLTSTYVIKGSLGRSWP